MVVFANNTVLSSFFFLFMDLNYLIPTVIAQIFNPTAELEMLKGKSRN